MIFAGVLGTSQPHLSTLRLTCRATLSKTNIFPAVTCVRLFSLWPWKPPKKRHIPKFSIVIPDGKKNDPDLTTIPAHIERPPYINNNEVIPESPIIWSHDQICKIRESCNVAKKSLDFAGTLVEPGISTEGIDRQTREFIVSHGAYPSPLGFKGFPKSISCSVNNVAAHGIPDNRKLQNGDIVNIDVTVYLDGYHGDCSLTYPVGQIDKQAEQLIQVTSECLDIGISICNDDVPYRMIGKAVDVHCKSNGFLSIQYLLGHGIGTFFHGPPDIYHCLNSYPGKMKEGMVFTVEPCITEGSRRFKLLEDDFTLLTEDNSRTAQAEHTILVTRDGYEILTVNS